MFEPEPEPIGRPGIIDNRTHFMSGMLKANIPKAKLLAVSTGYFDVAGYWMIRDALETAVNRPEFAFNLLLGKEAMMPHTETFEEYKRRRDPETMTAAERLDGEGLNGGTYDATTSLTNLLRRENVSVRLSPSRFNHSKCYILHPECAIIGSSNLTHAGLSENYELNAGLYGDIQTNEAKKWFEEMWESGTDTKDDLISMLEKSKFGKPPAPYEVYIKMIFEKYKDRLDEQDNGIGEDRGRVVPLAGFQKDAVRTALQIIREHGGCIIADSTGLGKTNMGIEIARRKVDELKRTMLVAPSQVLNSMWLKKLSDVDIKFRKTVTIEKLGREDFLKNPAEFKNIDFVLVDESQNFRTQMTNKRINLAKLLTVGRRKEVVLLSATPINNSIMDLYWQISLITKGNDRHFWRTVGIRDLKRHMKKARKKEHLMEGLAGIQGLLDAVMVRRTRSYIKDVYPEDKINNNKIRFPKHEYAPIRYSLSSLYGNVYADLLEQFDGLTMAAYGIEQYNTEANKEEQDRHRVHSHMQKILLLKRFESSIVAVRKSIKNKMTLCKYVRKHLESGLVLKPGDFGKLLIKWRAVEDGEDGVYTRDRMDEYFIERIKKLDLERIGRQYDIKGLKADLDKDIHLLNDMAAGLEPIKTDRKLDAVVDTIRGDGALEGGSKKVLIFTEYVDTATYLHKKIEKIFDDKKVDIITGRTSDEDRVNAIMKFSPEANRTEESEQVEYETDILISTEILAEGQNLQDCNYVINYDLPWNPMRIVQRTGRVDRLTSRYDTIQSRACYPDEDLDALLNLMGKVLEKVETANIVIGLDAELLGTVPESKQFGTIRNLAGGKSLADDIIKSIGLESDMMFEMSPMNEIQKYIREANIGTLEKIPMGRRSGLAGDGQKVVLTYLLQNPRLVRFAIYDYSSGKVSVPDDDMEVMKLIMCGRKEMLYLPMDVNAHHESFDELVRIDAVASKAMADSEAPEAKIGASVFTDYGWHQDATVMGINAAITDAMAKSMLSEEEADRAGALLDSPLYGTWAGTAGNLYAEYKNDGNISKMVAGLIRIADLINVPDGVEPEEGMREERDPVLVGAVFITGNNFDPDLGKNKLRSVDSGSSLE